MYVCTDVLSLEDIALSELVVDRTEASELQNI